MRRLVDFCKRVQGNNMTKMPPLSDRLPFCLKKKKRSLPSVNGAKRSIYKLWQFVS